MDSSRRNPKAGCSLSDIAVYGSVIAASLAAIQHPGLRDVLLTYDAPGNPVGVVGSLDEVGLAGLLGQPAQRRHAVLERSGSDRLRVPALDQGGDVLWLQARRMHVLVAHLLELIGDEIEKPLPIRSGGKAAVAVVAAELLQFIVERVHVLVRSVPPVSVFIPDRSSDRVRLLPVSDSLGECFCPSRLLAQSENHKGHGRHHSRFVQGFCCLPALHGA